MNIFLTLYHYELKKIIKRKLVWISLFICLGCIVMAKAGNLSGNYYVDGEVVDTHYHMFQVDSAYRRALSGRVVAQELLEETMTAYGKIPAAAERYTETEEYQKYARPYNDIFQLIWKWTRRNPFYEGWNADEQNLYDARTDWQEETWTELFLSDTEKAFWREKEEQIDKPFTYFYHEGYSVILKDLDTVGILLLLLTAVCLSGVFPEEHMRRMDQMILSSAKGRTIAYWAKLSAGISVSFICAVLMGLAAVTASLIIYGTEGFQTAVQMYLYLATYSYPISIGEACFIAYGVFLVTAVLMSVLVMVVSELLHNSIATLALFTGFIIVGVMINIPSQYRIVAQIWQSLPMRFLSCRGLFSQRLVVVGRHCFTVWQTVPILYVLCGTAAAVAGVGIYRRYQMSGR
ncbi:MAG: hypothetical protein K2L82_11340 [Lachnospiraceae bacterium]|nr:hypothetical protein [Lachnospiraceae bacterium]